MRRSDLREPLGQSRRRSVCTFRKFQPQPVLETGFHRGRQESMLGTQVAAAFAPDPITARRHALGAWLERQNPAAARGITRRSVRLPNEYPGFQPSSHAYNATGDSMRREPFRCFPSLSGRQLSESGSIPGSRCSGRILAASSDFRSGHSAPGERSWTGVSRLSGRGRC